MAKKKTSESDLSFEESFDQLQEIVEKMEDGDLSLSDSLNSYEQGIRHLKRCYQALDQAEQKIKQLAEFDEDGNLITKDFESAAEDSESASPRKSNRKASSKKKGNHDELF